MDFDYDPERALWRPGRRAFLFMGGAAVLGVLSESLGGESLLKPGTEGWIEYQLVGSPAVLLHGAENVIPASFMAHHGLLQPYSVHQSVWRLSEDAQILWRPVQRPCSPQDASELPPHVHKYGEPWRGPYGGAEPPSVTTIIHPQHFLHGKPYHGEGFLPGDSVPV